MASLNKVNLEQKFFCVITGASKGIGRAIALKFALKFKSGSVLVVLARSATGLDETKSSILQINPSITVITAPTDLSKPDAETFDKILTASIESHNIHDFDVAMIVHNAGSVGDVSKKVIDLDNLACWQDYYALNVFGVAILNSVFFKIIRKSHNVPSDEFKTVVVNISSLIGIQPFKSMGYYGTGKSAKEMLFRVLAEEEKNVLVLNYAPGPVQTDMIQTVIDKVGDAEIKHSFESMRDENKILTTDQTTSKLLEVLQNGVFKSGDHVDYFD